MRNISYIIADDELIYCELLQQYLLAVPDIICLNVCENALEVNKHLQLEKPDLLILDIEMPGLSGLQLVKSLDKQPYIIFISSHPEYALDAFEVDAIDFIKKPIPPERLMRAVEKVRSLLTMKDAFEHQESFQKNDATSFFIREDSAYVRVNYDEVLFFESLTDFVKIYVEHGKEKMVLVNLKNLLQQLPDELFLRISRTHIVNKKRIVSVTKESVFIGKIQLPVGITYADKIIESVVGNTSIKRHI